ncbi:MAG TPA: hypothetical protein VNQ14_00730, partial [Woeseiaceae bacterium]|nr:hypothetical protein [Woeseiaceae bacterium]
MTGSTTYLPHFPGSRYAAELGKKERAMRFPPELEREYHAFYLAERRSHVRSFNVIMLAIVVLALAVSVLPAGTDIVQHARIAAIACAYLVLIWASYSRYYDRVYLGTASGASVFIALVAAIEIASQVSAGAGE